MLVGSSKKVLVLNSGSTSQKVALVETSTGTQGEAIRTRALWSNEQTNLKSDQSRYEAIEILIAEGLRETGLSSGDFSSIGHRVVHGGSDFVEPQIVDQECRKRLDDLVSLAPLHNLYAVEGMNYCFERHPELPQIALFDTGFHSTIPEKRLVYALPYSWYQNHGVRKYGFHGINLSYCLVRLKELLGEGNLPSKLVIAHLGGGCSVTAVEGGKSVDTTMGFTPLEGMIMATRSGSIDPGILGYIAETLGYDMETTMDILNRESGIKGVSGLTGDMQELILAGEAGLQRAQLAIDMFVDSAAKYISAMVASLGGLDGLVFTGGIGENSELVRSLIVERLSFLNLNLASEVNSDLKEDGKISRDGPDLYVIRANENSQIARECHRLVVELKA